METPHPWKIIESNARGNSVLSGGVHIKIWEVPKKNTQKWMVYFVENPGKSHGKGIFWLGFSMVLPISGNLHTKMQYTSRVNLRFPQENHQTRGFSSPTDCKYMWLHPPENTIGKPQENGDVSKKNRDLIGVVADFWSLTWGPHDSNPHGLW